MAQTNPAAPRNPASVSGPGSLSKRTDLAGQPQRQLANAAYGEQKEFQAIQGGAKMQQAAPQPLMPMPQVTPMGAPSQRPDEPVTAGYSVGPGPGREALGFPSSTDTRLADFQKLAQYMPLMEHYVNSGASSGTMKNFMRYLSSQTQ